MSSIYSKRLTWLMTRILFYAVLYLIIPFTVHAQKLPSVQKSSLRASLDVKIDGNPNEWGSQLQAYNHATNIFYTMANDDNNLYLVIRINDPDALIKITNKGIILQISRTGKKSDREVTSITYPVFEIGHKPYIQFAGITAMPRYQREAMERNLDSVSKVANKKLRDNEKFIRTAGMPDIDTLLSIYNREGIRATEAFDNTMTYTYELAVPLKLLNLDVNHKAVFAYHIILKGLSDDDFASKMTTTANGGFHISAPSGASGAIPKKEHLDAVSSTTDFWGEYTLAKK